MLRHVGQAQPAEHPVAAEIGELRRDIELVEGFVVLAVFGEMRAVVAAQAHELEEILCPLGVLERTDIVAMMSDVVAVDASDHRQHGVCRREGFVVACPFGQLEGLVGFVVGGVAFAS